ncbi:MAG: transcription antitermination factor NusB [Bacteriovoracaceae bacterium]|nr:transcription antitermination factor NusB [Bacteriovoracaceae bacterium]
MENVTLVRGRRKAREYAFLFFYRFQIQINKLDGSVGSDKIKIKDLRKDAETTLGVLEHAQENFVEEIFHYALVEKTKLEELVIQNLTNWKIERLNPVDLTAILLALVEMKFLNPPTPTPVVINEYVELAKTYGNEQSGSFVNGLLEKLGQLA